MGGCAEARGMSERLKVGIAGFGAVGRLRRKVVDEHENMRTIAVCDRAFDGCGVLPDGARFYPDYSALLAEPLDALFVCLPNYLAPEVTMAGLERGMHVFCEKPPGRDLADVVRVVRCERRHPGLKLMYGFNHRYHDSVRDALRVVSSGELGRVLNLRGVYGKSKMIRFDADWRTKREMAGGGILLDQGIHMVDMLRLFAGEFEEIHSVVSNDFWRHDVEDNVYALMRSRDGAVAMLHSSATQWRHRFSLDIALERGTIALAGILSSTKSYGAETITIAYADSSDRGDPKEVMTLYNEDHSWHDEIAAFADVILHDKPVVAGSSMEALGTMHLVYRVYCADSAWRERFNLSDALPPEFL